MHKTLWYPMSNPNSYNKTKLKCQLWLVMNPVNINEWELWGHHDLHILELEQEELDELNI